MEQQPCLCEPGVRYFIGCSLKESRKFKDKYITLFFNIFMTFLFVVTVTAILFSRYKGHRKPHEEAVKKRKQQEYIVSKLQHLAAIKENKNQNMITNLPSWRNNPELQMLKTNV